MKPLTTNLFATTILPAILILAGIVIFLMTYWPSGITVDRDNNINLGVAIGISHKIPADKITISEVPDGVLYVVNDWRTDTKVN